MVKKDLNGLMSIGIDIGKDTFHIVGFDTSGQRVLRKQIRPLTLAATFDKLAALYCWTCQDFVESVFAGGNRRGIAKAGGCQKGQSMNTSVNGTVNAAACAHVEIY